ncbi:MAG: DUF1538 domain-containing protein [Firmicutes bacterium]|jgi:hypothetical protein|nr:DUF1538 domain-containing protein [Bacillota bacterium]
MKYFKGIALEVLYSIIPITAVIVVLQFSLIGLPIDIFLRFLAGVVMVILGLILFLAGMRLGILPIGELIGAALPGTGKAWLMVLFGFVLGLVATVAEPNVQVLAYQVDAVSGAVIHKNVLIFAVALGVAVFVGLGMLRIILKIPLAYLLVGGYGLVFFLSALAPPQFAPISFDAAGVITGPLIVPFLLALGVGTSAVLSDKTSVDGFGLVALAAIGPILAVLLLGVIYF